MYLYAGLVYLYVSRNRHIAGQILGSVHRMSLFKTRVERPEQDLQSVANLRSDDDVPAQRLPWIHVDDLVAMYLAALDGAGWSGAVNATAPDPPTNAEFSRALGRALHRPALAPVPGFAVRALYGEMADIVVHGQRAVPERALALGFRFAHPGLDEALRSALSA